MALVDFTTKPQPLNRLPIGLLDLFGIKSMGRYPQLLNTDVQPTLDLLRWYTESQALHFSLVGTSWTVGTVPLPTTTARLIWPGVTAPDSQGALPVSGGRVTVPNSEIWLVSQYSAAWEFDTAGQVAELGLGYLMEGSLAITHLPTKLAGATVGARGAGSVTVDAPFYLQPGCSLCASVLQATCPAGSIVIVGRTRLMRFLI